MYVENIFEIDEIHFYEDDDITEIEIDNKLAECDLCPSKKFLLRKIIVENKKVFNKRPGLIKDFEYKLELKDTSPLNAKLQHNK